MSKAGRKKNTFYNFVTSMGGQLISIVMQFVVRTVFIHTLGKAYLGIGGLFSNILTMLSLTEMGVGSAIVFKLYKPIAENDQHRITLLMRLYKQIYRVIGVVVVGIGIFLIPFLPKIINDYDKLESLNINVILIFSLYLLKSSSSYFFFAYKSALVKASQKEYLLSIIGYFFQIGLGISQIILLLVFPRFELYIALGVTEVIVKNIIWAKLADIMYPYINYKVDDRITSSEIREIFRDCRAIFLYKLNGVVLKATDNIVISAFLGIEMVGMYSNYYIFYTTLNTVFSKIFNSVGHSLGNLHAEKEGRGEYDIFKVAQLITVLIGGTAGVGIFVCSDELVKVWIGKDWVLAQPFSLLLGIEVFTLSLRHFLGRYRTSLGLFQQAKYRPVFGMVINLAVSIILVKCWGICGVLVGTITADWTTIMWYDPIIIHKYGFKNEYPVSGYFIRIEKYTLITIAVGALDYWLCSFIMNGLGWLSVAVHVLICAITVPACLILTSFGTYEEKYIINTIKKYVTKVSSINKS